MYFLHNLSKSGYKKFELEYSKNGTFDFLACQWINALSNKIIIIDKNEKTILFVNKKAKESDMISSFLYKFNKCKNRYSYCKHKSECEDDLCIIHKSIDVAISSKNTQILKNFLFNYDNNNYKLDLNISLIGEVLLIEVIKINYKEFYNTIISSHFNTSDDLIFFKNKELNYLFCNRSFLNFFPNINPIGKKSKDFILDSNFVLFDYESDLKALENKKYLGFYELNSRSYQISKEFIHGGVLGIITDVTEHNELLFLANIDNLTKLFNRHYYEKFIKSLYLEMRESFLILIDLDNLKYINNYYGHATGDKYIEKLALLLKEFLENKFTTLFRIGGDEFAVISTLNKKDIIYNLNKLYAYLSELNLTPSLSISSGMSLINFDVPFLENYKNVDMLLYKAKEKGKNQFYID